MKDLNSNTRNKLNYLKENYEVEVHNDKPGGFILVVIKNKLQGFCGDPVMSLTDDGIDGIIKRAEELQPKL